MAASSSGLILIVQAKTVEMSKFGLEECVVSMVIAAPKFMDLIYRGCAEAMFG